MRPPGDAVEGGEPDLLDVLREATEEVARLEAAGSDGLDELHRLLGRATYRAADLAHDNAELQNVNDDLQQFAYVASHDLSEPLRAIAGPISLLSRRYQGRLDTEADTYIAFAIEGCRRMQAIIDDLLAYCSAGHFDGSPQRIDLDELVPSVLAGLRQVIDETGARVSVGPLPSVWGDPAQVSAVFQNLISNALKFVRPGEAPCIDVSAVRVGDGYEIRVSDNGIGIDPGHRDRIFGVFKRLHVREEYPGTGIGLAVAKKIVERHGGGIGVLDAPGGGSTFWFTLGTEPEDGS